METASSRTTLEQRQLQRLRQMLHVVLPANEFYRKKFSAHGSREIESMESLKGLPLTTKGELVEDQMRHPPFGTDLTFPAGTLHSNPSDLGHHRKADVLARHRRVLGHGGRNAGRSSWKRRVFMPGIAFILLFRLVRLSDSGPAGRVQENSAPWRSPAADSLLRSG